jgi:hypothetical protein
MQQLIRMYYYGDSFLIPEALKVLEESLTTNIPPLTKILSLKVIFKYIQLLNELFKAGEFDALEFCRKLMTTLIEQIASIGENDLTLKRGNRMFGGEDDGKYGRIYYSELLRSISLWSYAITRDPFRITKSNYESEFTKTYRILKDVRKYEFPQTSEEDLIAFKNE